MWPRGWTGSFMPDLGFKMICGRPVDVGAGVVGAGAVGVLGGACWGVVAAPGGWNGFGKPNGFGIEVGNAEGMISGPMPVLGAVGAVVAVVPGLGVVPGVVACGGATTGGRTVTGGGTTVGVVAPVRGGSERTDDAGGIAIGVSLWSSTLAYWFAA